MSEVEQRPELVIVLAATGVNGSIRITKYCTIDTYCAFENHVDSKIQSSTDECIFRYRQSNDRRLLPASDYCRVQSNQIVEHSSDNAKVLGSCPKLGGAAKHLIDGSEKHNCRLSFEC